MIKDLPLGAEPLARVIGREALATAAAGILYPFGWIRRRRLTPRRAEQRTVVFVHGYYANKSCFLPLQAYLRAHGVRNMLSYEYPAHVGAEAAAIGLKEFLRARVRGGRVDLVCHSLGGVIARVYLQQLGGSRRVDRCITLGSPHRGTYNAYWVASRVGRELRPDSPLLARLAATRDAAAGVRFLSIVGSADNIVIPRVFGSGDEELVVVPGAGHLGLLFAPPALRAVLNGLEALPPARPQGIQLALTVTIEVAPSRSAGTCTV